jgi:hypothetical protein
VAIGRIPIRLTGPLNYWRRIAAPLAHRGTRRAFPLCPSHVRYRREKEKEEALQAEKAVWQGLLQRIELLRQAHQ